MPKTQPFYLLSQINVEKQQENEPRQFSGIANSGKPFSQWDCQYIVDMDGILDSTTHPNNMPVLYLHKREKEVGYGKLSVENNQLLISGTLLSNERATAIATSADEGFPWQMSAHVIPSSVEEVKTGTVQVNGQTLSAPINVLRKCKISEVSFTPTGVDDQTSATVLSDDGSENPNPQPQETIMTEEEIKAMQAENKQLKKDKAEQQKIIDELKAKKKKADVDAQLSQAGFAKNADGEFDGISSATVEVLLSLDDDKSKAMIADLANSVQLSQSKDKQTPPDFMFGETNPPNEQNNQQAEKNPLLAVALSRNQDKNGFI